MINNGKLEPVAANSQQNYAYDEKAKHFAGTLAPNAGGSLPFNPLNDGATGKPAPLTQEIIDKISSGELKIFVHGKLDYQDIFGDPHWTTYCAQLTVPFNGQFLRCETHNDTDDYK